MWNTIVLQATILLSAWCLLMTSAGRAERTSEAAQGASHGGTGARDQPLNTRRGGFRCSQLCNLVIFQVYTLLQGNLNCDCNSINSFSDPEREEFIY